MNGRDRAVQIWLHSQNVLDYPDLSDWTVARLQDEFGLSKDDATDLQMVVGRVGGQTLYGFGTDGNKEEAVRMCTMVTESMHQGMDGYTDHDRFVISMYLNDIAYALALEAGTEK